MNYYFARRLNVDFEDAVRQVGDALRAEGFGIITEIDMKETFKDKIGVDFRNYRILGACNPKMALEAIKQEDKIGTMLPCNVVIQDAGTGWVEVAAIDPLASMAAVDNPVLKKHAAAVGLRLMAAMNRLPI